ncbi:GtrA family protein [Pseudoxanthomonas sp. SGT-18]|uniref:GtrA family protein n=1 Tax=Pseudoxanthomonas sp. SGT-18 TaxID=2493087 RepID=UPI0013DDBB3E|nr:GtrA family protein [Pseudoxanthomonas sp. SGT-18]
MNAPAPGEKPPVPPRGLPFSGAPGPLQRFVSDQRVLFLLVGGANTLFSTALFAALVLWFGPGVPSVVSLGIAWVVSLLAVFFVYRRLVFRVEGHFWLDLARFSSVNGMALLLNAGALALLVDLGGLPAIPVQVAITALVVVFNYVGHKYFSFRRKGRP